MAITDVQLKYESGRYNREGRFYTETYLVVTDDATTSIPAILTASFGAVSIPAIGAAHPDDASARVHEIGEPQRQDDLIWHVPVRYQRTTARTPEEDPLDDPVQIDWGFVAYQKALDKDKDGAAIVNTMGDLFDPPAEIDKHYLCVTIVRNEATFNPATADAYMDSVNSSACTIAGLYVGVRKAKMVEFSGPLAERNGVEYHQVTYRIEFNPDTWDLNLLNHGMNCMRAGARETVIDEKGNKLTEPARLDAASAQITVSTASSHFVVFEVRDEKNFNHLGLNI